MSAVRLEEWLSGDGRLVELLLPRTDAGVAAQAGVLTVAFLLLAPLARRRRLLVLWSGTLLVTAGVFGLRALH